MKKVFLLKTLLIYTNDTVYLAQTAFPAMKSACEFWFDRLIRDENGKWIAPDEWSPCTAVKSVGDHSGFNIWSTKKELHIKVVEEVQCSVYNIHGNLLKRKKIKDNTSFPIHSGLYIVKIETGKDLFSKKIIVE